MELTQLLMWLVTDGIGAIAGWLLSNLLEPWPKWQTLDGYSKRLSVMGLTMLAAPLLGLGLYWLLSGQPPDRLALIMAFQAGFVAYAGSQYAHAPRLRLSGLRKDLGGELLEAYHNHIGPGGALTSDAATRFAYQAQCLVEKTLDKRAQS